MQADDPQILLSVVSFAATTRIMSGSARARPKAGKPRITERTMLRCMQFEARATSEFKEAENLPQSAVGEPGRWY